jgi:hypothetical protein
MELQNFEDSLLKMTKPEVSELKHQDMLANAIIKAKDSSALSWWWLSIPLYVIAAFCMKNFFMPQATLISSIHEFSGKEKYLSMLLFLIMPIVLIILNSLSIRRVYHTLGNLANINLFRKVWLNLLMILFSILILLIYSL